MGSACTLYLSCVLFVLFPVRRSTNITMLDVGQGDCFVIREKGGKNIMIDGGSSSVKEVSKYRINPYLQYYGVKKIDFVFLSHGDMDHVNGILDILKNRNSDRIPISYLALTYLAKNDSKYDELRKAAKEAGTKILYMKNRQGIHIGDLSITSYTPVQDENQDENDLGQALIVDCENTRSLFLGDLSMQGELLFLKEMEQTQNCKPVDILKVAHHGSAHSSSEEFIERMTPKIGLISAGKNNSYGHPHKETLERLTKNQVQIFTSSIVGETRIEVHNGIKSVVKYVDQDF